MKVISQFNQTIRLECLSSHTTKSYRYHIKKFLSFYHNDLRQENIIKHLLYLQKKGYSAESLNVARASLIYFFNKILNKEITLKIPTQKRKKSIPKVVDKSLIARIIKVTTNLKHRTLIEFIYSSGIRLDEVHKIEWNDVDLLNCIIRINQGKGKKDRLTIISKNIIPHLLDLKDISPKNNKYVFFSN